MRIGAFLLAAATLAAGLIAMNAPGASAGGGCHRVGITDAEATEIRLTGNCFEPTVARVALGEEVTWVNEDPVPHTVTGVSSSFGDYEELQQGDTVTYTFDAEGVYPYFCVLHPSMIGAVVVGDGVGDGESVATVTKAAPDGAGGLGTGSLAAIGAAALAGTAALGLVTTRLVRSRRAA
jgi:plastocyanin